MIENYQQYNFIKCLDDNLEYYPEICSENLYFLLDYGYIKSNKSFDNYCGMRMYFSHWIYLKNTINFEITMKGVWYVYLYKVLNQLYD